MTNEFLKNLMVKRAVAFCKLMEMGENHPDFCKIYDEEKSKWYNTIEKSYGKDFANLWANEVNEIENPYIEATAYYNSTRG